MASATLEQEKSYWLLLNRIPGFGPAKFHYLLKQETCLANWFIGYSPNADLVNLFDTWNITPMLDWQGVEQDLNWELSHNCYIILRHDALYPPLLKEIANPPHVLFLQGNIATLSFHQIAMVGSRNPSQQGCENAFLFAKRLAQEGLTITSGLAIGIDTWSHKGALACNGFTIAVLAHGLDTIYPASNKKLVDQILQNKGALLSEFAIGTLPRHSHFPRRNRIISGLSLGVLVVEATLKSGSLITAKFAVEQGREVFALPGSIHNPLAKGCHHLIRQGAKCIESQEHILEELRPQQTPCISEPARIKSTDTNKENLPSDLHKILNHIGFECTPLDRIVEQSGLPSSKVSASLVELELHGAITLESGGYVRV
ncbi:MAG TPA: DNA-processing protein DprA [Gammaproteobacteria bacterium]|nr:DNA-processing protein DprA [Gammaproteobacteria bacterium]